MAQVNLKTVSKVFQGEVRAVDKVDIAVKDKEFVVLVGPSGCGKSTTLRMIAGLEEITDGEIYIDDRRVNEIPPKDRDIAMVFQNYALYPHMTAYDNMSFGLRLRHFPKPEIEKRVRDAADMLGIKELLQRKPKELSGGQRQRVAVGRAIVRKPKVFLFDEPLSNLDAKMRVQMRNEISRLHNRLQSTMIYVTHDQTEAMTMGDRIVVMRDGIVQQEDKPLSLYERPQNRFVAGFIGSPPMNFIEGMLIQREGVFYFKSEKFELKVNEEMKGKLQRCIGKKIILGIRPEDIHDKLYVRPGLGENTVTATVDLIEPMGAETYLYLHVGRQTLMARLKTKSDVSIHQDLEVVFDMNRVHFFDRETDKTIV
jgi:multiple sugar transport system ATP-binding protein